MSLTPRKTADDEQQPIVVSFAMAATAASITAKFFNVPVGKRFRVDKVEFINVTGLAVDTSNYFTLAVKNGSTVVAGTLSTHDDAIVANTFTSLTLSATDTARILAAADILSVVATKTGTQTLPAGLFFVHGRYV